MSIRLSPPQLACPAVLAIAIALLQAVATTGVGATLPPVTNGLVAHLDGTDVDGLGNATLTSGSEVATWVNHVSSDDATAIDPGRRPTLQTGAVNGLPALHFSSDTLRFGSLNMNQLIDTTIFMVAQAPSNTGFALSGSSTSTMRHNIAVGTFSAQEGWNYAQKHSTNSQHAVSSNTTRDFGQYRVVGARYDDDEVGDDSGNAYELLLSGNTFTGTVASGVTVADTSRLVQLGSRGNGSNAFSGDIAELLVYDRALPEPERRDVEMYLATKYQVPVSPGLVLYYPYESPDQLTPNDVTDKAGNGFDGTLTTAGSGSASFVNDKPRQLRGTQSLRLDQPGSADRAQIDAPLLNSMVDFNTDDWTFATFAQRNDDATKDNDFVFQLGDGDGFGGQDELWLYWGENSDTLKLEHNEGGAGRDIDIDLGSVDAGEWLHLALVREGSVMRVYMDGMEVATDNTFTLNMSTAVDIGGHQASGSHNRSFDGWLDDTAIWSRALDAGEIFELSAGIKNPLGALTIPEPTSLALLVLGLVGVGLRGRRRWR